MRDKKTKDFKKSRLNRLKNETLLRLQEKKTNSNTKNKL